MLYTLESTSINQYEKLPYFGKISDNGCAAIIQDSSMEPVFSRGSLLIFAQKKASKDRSYVVVQLQAIVSRCYFIPDEENIVIWPRQTFFDKYNEFLAYAFTIGIALESLRLAKDSFLIKSNSKLRKKLRLLQKKLNQCRKELRNPSEKSNSDILFADIINISWLCVQFSLLVCGGVGLLSRHSIQRLYREIAIWFIPRTYPSTIKKWIEKLII